VKSGSSAGGGGGGAGAGGGAACGVPHEGRVGGLRAEARLPPGVGEEGQQRRGRGLRKDDVVHYCFELDLDEAALGHEEEGVGEEQPRRAARRPAARRGPRA